MQVSEVVALLDAVEVLLKDGEEARKGKQTSRTNQSSFQLV